MVLPIDKLAGKTVVLGLSGGVDSAVAALRLKEAGAAVEALHMTNWAVADQGPGIPEEYRDRVFRYFLDEYAAGRTPNPDVLCNREIKFGVFREYAKRLGGELLATGHYARTASIDGVAALLRGTDRSKDQSYFLHAVSADALADTVFPLGDLDKSEVRRIARDHGLDVYDKKDSTGICFIGERPFREFLATYLPASPGVIRSLDGTELGTHAGLMYYTLGQRQGLGIGGRRDAGEDPWYVVGKDLDNNVLLVDQGDTEALFSDALVATDAHWIGTAPDGLDDGLELTAKVRYRQPDQACTVVRRGDRLEVEFAQRQRAVAPGQFVVFYDRERCLGGAVIHKTRPLSAIMRAPEGAGVAAAR